MNKSFKDLLEEAAITAASAKAEATERRLQAEQDVIDAKADQKAADADIRAVAKAQEKLDRAENLTREAMAAVYGENYNPENNTVTIDDETYEVKDGTVTEPEQEEKKTKNGNGLVAGLVIAAVLIAGGVGYALAKESKTGLIVDDKNKDNTDSKSMTDVYTPTDNTNAETDGVRVIPTENPVEFVVVDSKKEDTKKEDTKIVLVPEYEELTTDKFTDLVANYAKIYSDNNISVSTGDITKFATIVNIDRLAEDNKELVADIAKSQSKEEFLNDAAKVIGATVMKNFTIWNQTGSTKDFVRVSEVVFGDQKDAMLKIEEYMDKIAVAASKNDGDLVNSLVSEFINELDSGSLSKLDDGVGFGAQVNIAVIADGIARNYLTPGTENFERFQLLKTSEKYVSNIFTVYERCQGNAKTLTK